MRSSGRFSLLALAVAGLLGSACPSPSTMPRPDGGPTRVLDILEPPGAQIGLRYSETVALRVRYRNDDAEGTPLSGEVIRFAIFDDPGGSTLASDRATTDDDGVATVRLTGGAQETTFRVRATAADAPPVEFGITVSRLELVAIDVVLVGTVPQGAARSTALLFINESCATLPVTAPPPAPLRQLAVISTPPATIAFRNLLSRRYAILGRVEDTGGHALAAGCVDVGAQALPAGVTVTLTLPVEETTPSVIGRYTVDTTLQLGASEQAMRTQAWRTLGPCPIGVSSVTLDGIATRVSSTLASAIAAQRGPADASGCRPSMKPGGGLSLDAQLGMLLAGGPADSFDDLYADLLALIANSTLTSTLEISASGPRADDPPVARHVLEELRIGPLPGGARQTIALATTARTVLVAEGIAVTVERGTPSSSTVRLGLHGFTLDLGSAWLAAFRELALAPRLPSVMPQPPSLRALLEATIATASRNGKSGCAAVEDLVCSVTGASGCATTVAPACSAALDAEAIALEGAFADAPGLDYRIEGSATALDSDGDLRVDALMPGTFTTSLGAAAPFRGARLP